MTRIVAARGRVLGSRREGPVHLGGGGGFDRLGIHQRGVQWEGGAVDGGSIM